MSTPTAVSPPGTVLRDRILAAARTRPGAPAIPAAPARRASGSGPGPARLRHEPPLDGLRGLAVALVVVYHFEPAWLPGGFLGVDVFMVVSGFLITRLLLAEWDRDGGIALRAFWLRRARRLLPALGLALGGTALAAALWMPRHQLDALWGDALATIGYVANWHLIATGQSYVSAVGTPSPLRHTWSLAIEEQYYLVWPILVATCLALRRHGRALLAAVCVAGIAASTWAMVAAYDATNPDRAYYGTDARAQTLLVGAALALLVSAGRTRVGTTGGGRRVVVAAPTALAAVMLLAQAWLWRTASAADAWLYHGGFTLFALLTAGVVLVALRPGPVGAGLSWAPLRALGRISYGVYLWHWPVFVFLTPVRVGSTGLGLLAIRVTVTLALSIASYRLLEQPIRLRRWPDRVVGRVLAPAGLATIVAAFALVSTRAEPLPRYLRTAATSSGPTARTPEVVKADPGSRREAAMKAARASNLRPEADRRPVVLPEVALIQGDSVAASLEDALAFELAGRGISSVKSAVNGCGMITGSPIAPDGRPFPFGPACSEQVATRQFDDVSRYRPGVVLWISSWEARDREVDGVHHELGTPEGDEAVLGLMRQSVDRLTRKGAKVAVVTLPIPYDTAEVVHPEGLAEGVALMDDLLRRLAREDDRVDLVDLARLVCGPGDESLDHCPHRRDGIELRADGLHFGDDGAAWVAPRIADVLLDPDRWRAAGG